MKIGELIRSARTEAGFTQASLSEKLGVTQYAVSSWELGINFPSMPSIQKIAKLTNASFHELREALIQTRMANMEHGKPQAAKANKDPLQIDLRDYFAAKALQGLCAHGGVWGDHHAAEIAQSAYRVADAMLAERNKGREEE